jgi:putative intracellular protease/amidase
MTSYGLLIFEGAEELDFVGPWEVFTVSSMLRDDADRVMLIAPGPGPVRCAKGMRVLPDYRTDDHPPLDVLLVPGGQGTRREVGSPSLIGWIGQVSSSASWVTSVCTGALLLHEAGPARGRRVATHPCVQDTPAARDAVTVVRTPVCVDGT